MLPLITEDIKKETLKPVGENSLLTTQWQIADTLGPLQYAELPQMEQKAD